MPRWFLLFIILSFFPTLIFAQVFKEHHLKADGEVLFVQSACLIVGSPKQLIVSVRRGSYPNYSAHLLVYDGDKLKREYSFTTKEQPWAFSLAGDCAAGYSQKLILHFQAAYAQYTWKKADAKEFQQQVEVHPLPPALFTPEQGFIPYLQLWNDDNQDGFPDLLLPVAAGGELVWVAGSAQGATTPVPLHYPLKNYLRGAPVNQPLALQYSARQSQWFPSVARYDYNGDGRIDLLMPWLDELTIFLQNSKGSFSSEPPSFQLRQLQVLSEEDRSQANTTATILFGYIGNDPTVDLLVNRTSGAITDLKTQSKVHQRIGETSELVAELPAYRGQASNALLMDINNDKRYDVITASIQTGLFSTIQALINHTVDVRFHFYLTEEDGKIPTQPNFSRELTFKFHIKNFSPQGFLPTLVGDFNGDGLKDALFGRDDETLIILLQRPTSRLFPSQVSYRGHHKISETFLVDDLNGDGKSDLVFWYRDWKERDKILVLENLANL